MKGYAVNILVLVPISIGLFFYIRGCARDWRRKYRARGGLNRD